MSNPNQNENKELTYQQLTDGIETLRKHGISSEEFIAEINRKLAKNPDTQEFLDCEECKQLNHNQKVIL